MEELSLIEAVPLWRSQELPRDIGSAAYLFLLRSGDEVSRLSRLMRSFARVGFSGAGVFIWIWMCCLEDRGELFFDDMGLYLPMGGGSISPESRRFLYASART